MQQGTKVVKEVDAVGWIKKGGILQEIGMKEFQHFHDKRLWSLSMIGYFHDQITFLGLFWDVSGTHKVGFDKWIPGSCCWMDYTIGQVGNGTGGGARSFTCVAFILFSFLLGQLRTGFSPLAQWSRLCLSKFSK